MKRLIDIVGSIIGLILFFPFISFFVFSVFIKYKCNPFYTQERIGKNGKKFSIIKIRSMIPYAESISNWTTNNDKRITKIGKVMRKYNIDELPQFINVLKGDMSLVGPRPEIPKMVDRFEKQYKGYSIRKNVKPGMTGLSQAYGYRGDSCIFRRSVLDAFYVYRNNIFMDLFLIFLTIFRLKTRIQ